MIAALVCGRRERGSFPARNTFPLLGRPLMVYPILAALHAENVDRVFLTTDDGGIASIAGHHGAEVIERPEALCEPGVSLEAVVAHGVSEICRLSGVTPDAIVVLLANAPTVTSGQIDQGIRVLRADGTLTGVISVSAHDEFHPNYAVRLEADGRLRPYAPPVSATPGQVFFPDALLWVLRPDACTAAAQQPTPTGWLVDVSRDRVAALVHEGYGDVDYLWQIPLVEEWLRRHGFDEERTPYPPAIAQPAKKDSASGRDATNRETSTTRVLITTVPFGHQPRPLELLKSEGIEYVINPIGRRLTENELAAMVGDYDVLIAGTEPITAKVMDAAPRLRLISRVGIGLDSVDLAAARSRGIHVSYTPEAPAPAVAELTVGLMLSLLRDIPSADRGMRNGVWHRSMGRRLSAQTVGVVGVGRVGKRLIKHLTGGFPGIRIVANDLQPDLGFAAACRVEWR